ncbi:hypothetical protein BKA67DRAFT_535481 [Truncatella angustata]|uniref:Uncharacterized protein n=1 Tax=Truncatella angustata TaxID=152316 RepID=A0A9P8UKW7_9PEZI|nr:uncharacterized protein BKA67DRAFT_535481 [Truncatella angustata]KAH6654147.1 hypothetical protein BKA67DRAFT_535481 [Truncatella angustata]
MWDDLETPIALRRTPRRSTGNAGVTAPSVAASKTPTTSRTGKRVRFSDPGPELSYKSPSSTGLTPMVRRSTIGVTPSRKRRRHSTPSDLQDVHDADELAGTSETPNVVRVLSLRQILDDRLKRRIRRNGLSEEMNTIEIEKRHEAQRQASELQHLREELAEKDEEIERLKDATILQDTARIMELEQEVGHLRAELNRQSDRADQTHHDWTMAARDPFSDSVDDDGFGDATMADLVCSTPSRARASFPTPPCTSPTMPTTPMSIRRFASSPVSHTGVQAQLPDPEKELLEAELGSLRLELGKLNEALEIHEALRARMADRLSSVESSEVAGNDDVEAHLGRVLQSLSDKTAALAQLNSSISSLGFRGNDAGDIVSSVSRALRSARLELEYITPGEIALPLSSHGAQVLDLVLTRLRDLARQVKEDEASIDEYHSLELSLRQQLGARVEAMDGLQRELKRSTCRLGEKDERITELEIGTDRLKGAIEKYRRDVSELETLVQTMEEQGQDAEARLQANVETGKQQSAKRDTDIAALEEKVTSVLSQTAEVRIQLADVQAKRVANITALNKSHGTALAIRDARVTELRGEIDSINESLRNAHETIRQLKVENLGLKRDIEGEKKRAKQAVDSMKTELERVLEMSEGILATPKKVTDTGRRCTRSSDLLKTPGQAALPPAGPSGFLVDSGKGKRKRRHDSGLGFLDEEEYEV